jgi:glucokinase
MAEGPVMPLSIAIDLGGTQIRAALVDADGDILNRMATATQAMAGPAVVVQQLLDAAHDVSRDVDASNIIGVGVSSPGPLDTEHGIAIGLPTIKDFDNVPLLAMLQDKLPHKVHLENDGIAAAIGEWKFGAGKGLQSLVYVTVSTGIGGGVIVDGRVMRGRKGMAGHIGHMAIMPHGLRCNCGSLGCWEAYAAGPAFTARANAKSAADVFAAAKQGDEAAQKHVDDEVYFLSLGMTSLLHLYSPQAIIVGGGLSNAFDQLHPGISDYVMENAMPAFRDVPIVKAALGGNSGLIGAAALVFENK